MAEVSVLSYVLQYLPILNLYFKAGINASSSDSKWGNCIYLSSRGRSLSEMFTLWCTDVWNQVCLNVRYTYLCHKHLITTFNRYYIYVISADISDIRIFLFPNTDTSISRMYHIGRALIFTWAICPGNLFARDVIIDPQNQWISWE